MYFSLCISESWHCVATVFFIDTAHNIISYIETIWKILKPGGYWVNMGECIYTWIPVSYMWICVYRYVCGCCGSFGWIVPRCSIMTQEPLITVVHILWLSVHFTQMGCHVWCRYTLAESYRYNKVDLGASVSKLVSTLGQQKDTGASHQGVIVGSSLPHAAFSRWWSDSNLRMVMGLLPTIIPPLSYKWTVAVCEIKSNKEINGIKKILCFMWPVYLKVLKSQQMG